MICLQHGRPGFDPWVEDPVDKGMAMHSCIVAWRIPMDRGAWRATSMGVTKSWAQLSNEAHVHIQFFQCYRLKTAFSPLCVFGSFKILLDNKM